MAKIIQTLILLLGTTNIAFCRNITQDDLTKHLMQTSKITDHNWKAIQDMKGILNAIGIGGHVNRCGASTRDRNNGWLPMSSTTCVKFLTGTYSMDAAKIACGNEYRRGEDAQLPRVLSYDLLGNSIAMQNQLNSFEMDEGSSIWIEETELAGSESPYCVRMSKTANGFQKRTGPCSMRNLVVCETSFPITYSGLNAEQSQLSYLFKKFISYNISEFLLPSQVGPALGKFEIQLNKEVELITRKLNSSDTDIEKIKTDIIELEQHHILHWQTNDVIESLKSENEELSKKLIEMDAIHLEMKNEIKTSNSKHDELKEDLELMKEAMQNLEKRVGKTEWEINKAEFFASEMKQELNNSLKNVDLKLEKLSRKNIEDFRKARDYSDQQYADLEIQILQADENLTKTNYRINTVVDNMGSIMSNVSQATNSTIEFIASNINRKINILQRYTYGADANLTKSTLSAKEELQNVRLDIKHLTNKTNLALESMTQQHSSLQLGVFQLKQNISLDKNSFNSIITDLHKNIRNLSAETENSLLSISVDEEKRHKQTLMTTSELTKNITLTQGSFEKEIASHRTKIDADFEALAKERRREVEEIEKWRQDVYNSLANAQRNTESEFRSEFGNLNQRIWHANEKLAGIKTSVLRKGIKGAEERIDWLLRGGKVKASTAAELPTKIRSARAIYDTDDSVYIIGGYAEPEDELEGENLAIYRYNISGNSYTLIKNIQPVENGALALDPNGNIHIISHQLDNSGAYLKKIQTFNPTGNRVTTIEKTDTYFYKTVLDTNRKNAVYLFGGQTGVEHHVQCMSINLNSFGNCGNLTLLQNNKFSAQLIIENRVFVFSDNENVEIINLANLTSSLRATTLPRFKTIPHIVTDGKYGYFMGGYKNTANTPKDALIRFDPVSLKHELIQVQDFPGQGSHNFDITASVYVEKLNRIYIFGGYSDFNGYGKNHKETWFIDLDSMPPPRFYRDEDEILFGPEVFSCANRSNGLYKHPNAKEKFIQCQNNIMKILSCPEQLLFNAEKSTCEFPTDEKLNGFCDNKENGMYPHPRKCEMFIGCRNGILEFFKCPGTLIFDKRNRKCDFSEIASCRGK